MKILITGSESFVGKELIAKCKEAKIEVIGIDSIKPENPNYEFYHGFPCLPSCCRLAFLLILRSVVSACLVHS